MESLEANLGDCSTQNLCQVMAWFHIHVFMYTVMITESFVGDWAQNSN